MTTIAANRECMAADRYWSLSDGTGFSACKLWRHKDEIYGSCGKGADWHLFQRYVLGKVKDIPTITDEEGFAVLKLNKQGIWYFDYSCIGVLIDGDCYAIGGGALGAMIAMDCGLAPEGAVEACTKRHDGTKGPVDTFYLAGSECRKPR